MAFNFDTIKHHGILNALYAGSLNAINNLFFIRIITCIAITKVKEKPFEIDSKFKHGFLNLDQLSEFSKDKDCQLSQDFLNSALTKGDKCYGLIENNKLAGYGWYSNGETLTDIQELKFCFDPSFVYMYKGLTLKSYRGQRLHAIGMEKALGQYLEKGFSGIVSYVDSTNFDSLKSCWRMGYEKVGTIIVVKVFGKIFSFSSKSCEKHNIRLKA